jgi:hypothetical protein
MTMKDDDQGNVPISDDDFSQEMGNLTRRMRRKHFFDILVEGLSPCVHCGEGIFKSQAFCTYCGKRNPNYDEAEFELENGKTVREISAAEGCPDTHAALRKGLRDDEDLKPREGKMYCSECGGLVDINA